MDMDITVTIPADGGPCRVEQPAPGGKGKEIFLCAPHTIGRFLANLDQDPTLMSAHWVDLLGASSPGIALKTSKGGGLDVILAFGPRVKTGITQLHHRGTVTHVVNFPLPPTVWLQRYNSNERLTGAHLWVAQQRPTSVADEVRVLAFPYANVDLTNRALVCWGNVTTTVLKPEDPVACDNLFWATNFNDHISHVEYLKPKGGRAFGGFDLFAKWLEDNPNGELEIDWEAAAGYTRGFNAALGQALHGRE